MLAFHVAVGGFDVIDPKAQRQARCGNTVLNGFFGQIISWWSPPVFESHSSQRDDGNLFFCFSEPPVFHRRVRFHGYAMHNYF